jgi:peptidoglycan/xylan/chitin deacetylase (PgdA/CDA1 family)
VTLRTLEGLGISALVALSSLLAACGEPAQSQQPVAPSEAGASDGGAPHADGGSPAGDSGDSADAAVDDAAPVDSGSPSTSSFKVEGVTTWRGGAVAAYSVIHDDVCDPSALGVFSVADGELKSRALRAGFGVIVGTCDKAKAGTWAQVNTLVSHGHDVFGHSWDHPCITNDGNLAQSCDPAAPRSVDFDKEIGNAGTTLKSKAGVSLDFFIFPYDVCDPAAIAYLKSKGYLGARCGTLATNPPDFGDAFAVNYDVYGPSYSRYFGKGACAKTASGKSPVQYETVPADYTEACRRYVLNQYVDDAIAAKGWGIRELHGFDPSDNLSGGWETVNTPDYRAHLDYLLTKIAAGDLWVDGPTPVLRYRFAREAQTCALPAVAAGNTLHFSAPSAACQKYATILSYRVATTDSTDPTALHVRQAGATLPVKRISAGHYVVDADPTKGDAVLEN